MSEENKIVDRQSEFFDEINKIVSKYYNICTPIEIVGGLELAKQEIIYHIFKMIDSGKAEVGK